MTQPAIVVDVDVDECADADDDEVLDVSTVTEVEHLLNQHDLRTDYRVPDAINQLDRQLCWIETTTQLKMDAALMLSTQPAVALEQRKVVVEMMNVSVLLNELHQVEVSVLSYYQLLATIEYCLR